MRPDVDLLVLGGGCAGLSLGLRLAEQPATSRHTLILEARPEYSNDRTWCFWRFAPHRFEHLVSHAWPAMVICSRQRSVDVDCRRTPYQMLEALPFYAAAQAAIARSDSVELRLGTDVHEPPRRVGDGWSVDTEAGAVTARCIVDTRPPGPPQLDGATLWQSFFGQEIACEAAVFDPSKVGLMDFAGGRTDGVLFHYVLPSSPYRALIETTVFGPRPLAVASLAGLQSAAVDRLRLGAGFAVLRAESGVLPMGMTARFPPPGPGYCRVGLMSGAARPSTGYAFLRIQRWADAAAASVASGNGPLGHRRDPALQRAMDRLFLQVLRGHPDRAPDLFTRMFGDIDPARVIRFLSDRGSIADCAAIGLSLPLPLFVREMLRGMVSMPAPLRAPT